MKKEWRPVKWEDIRPRDKIRWRMQEMQGDWIWSYPATVEHIGARYAKMKEAPSCAFKNLWRRFKEDTTLEEQRYQRLELVKETPQNCPFCGDDAFVEWNLSKSNNSYRVECNLIICDFTGPWMPTRPKAIAAWNSIRVEEGSNEKDK